jgi:hypothetical protein
MTARLINASCWPTALANTYAASIFTDEPAEIMDLTGDNAEQDPNSTTFRIGKSGAIRRGFAEVGS